MPLNTRADPLGLRRLCAAAAAMLCRTRGTPPLSPGVFVVPMTKSKRSKSEEQGDEESEEGRRYSSGLYNRL